MQVCEKLLLAHFLLVYHRLTVVQTCLPVIYIRICIVKIAASYDINKLPSSHS